MTNDNWNNFRHSYFHRQPFLHSNPTLSTELQTLLRQLKTARHGINKAIGQRNQHQANTTSMPEPAWSTYPLHHGGQLSIKSLKFFFGITLNPVNKSFVFKRNLKKLC